MNIGIIGSGGREHAFAYKVLQSKLCKKLFCIPGNAGTKDMAINVNIDITNFIEIGEFCLQNEISLLIVGPEIPLVLGIYDYFKKEEKYKNILVFGPSAKGAMLEGSKDFSKAFMQRNNIPTAHYATFTNKNIIEGIDFIKSQQLPIVLKADGLAAGKGVLICNNYDEAISEFKALLQGKFGESSQKVVIEQFLHGIEYSVFVITDGKNFKILPEAKDYKRIGEGDTGLNTGGMGAISPVPFVSADLMKKTVETIIKPTIHGLQKEGIEYIGFIYFGLIKVGEKPFTIEYNCRLGDPETQVVLPRLENDLLDLILACFENQLQEKEIKASEKHCVTTVLASKGYPESSESGVEILFPTVQNPLIFHSGTKYNQNKIETNGGRVLAVSALGNTLNEAIYQSQLIASQIIFDGKYYRKDIGNDVLGEKK
jgi:phosphoribosylamine--glycine ligase